MAIEPCRPPSSSDIHLCQCRQVALGIFYIVHSAELEHLFLVIVEFAANFPWRAHHHRAIRHFHTLWNQSICSDQTVLANLRAVQNHRIDPNQGRSEEHTSELQSRPHLVCRLLLEKKKKY